MSYLAIMAEEAEQAKRRSDGPVPKTGLRRFHDSIKAKITGGR